MGWSRKIRSKVWKLGSNVDTDQILPGYAMAYPVEKLKEFALAGSEIPDFARRVRSGDIIVADENFGCGSSREQAPVALKKIGVGLIIARSFARIFRRNSINIGLPVLMADLVDRVHHGDEIEVDLVAAEITLVASGEKIQGQVLAPGVLEILQAGGLIARVRQKLIIP